MKSAKRSRKPRAVTRAATAAPSGQRVGKKKSDRRWQTLDGKVWASKLEADVYEWLQHTGVSVRTTERGRDTISYKTRIADGVCESCGHCTVLQEHTYTPDLFTSGTRPDVPICGYWEIKGFLRPKDRRILRGVNKAGAISRLFLLLQREHAGTIEWATKFLKGWRIGVWTNPGIKIIV